MTHNNAEDCGQRSPGRAVREEGAIPDNPADAEDGQDFLCAICDGVIFERINSCGKHICELVWLGPESSWKMTAYSFNVSS